MFSEEIEQIRKDRKLVPRLVDRYCPETDRKDAIRMVRQINAVNTYLSWMARGAASPFHGAVFGTAIAAMDEVTDELNEELADGRVREALRGNPQSPQMAAVDLAADFARGPQFAPAMRQVAKWQDASLEQFDDPSVERVREITEMKGGASALAHLHMVSPKPTDSENDYMKRFGYTMQLLDDYMDQPGDEDDGITTLFTLGVEDHESVSALRQLTVEEARKLWGDRLPVARFDRLTRWHLRLGRVENDTPLRARWLCPWYL